MTLGERVLILRRRARLSQEELAHAVGVDRNTVTRWENGTIETPTGDTIRRLALVLQVTTDILLGVTDFDDMMREIPPTAAEGSEATRTAVGHTPPCVMGHGTL